MRLGDLYNKGLNGRPDHARALDWWTKAAQKLDTEAQLRLARAYGLGRGTARNYEIAYRWASLAAIQGNETAAELRDKLISRLRPDEIERADRAVDAELATHNRSRSGKSS